jgi:XTP/dITP diphosphohydrolase
MEIVIASTNLHKIREFREMMKHLHRSVDLFSLLNFSMYEPLPEEAHTFKDNAIQKAEHAAKALNKWVLADDSGLVVPALNGAPGIRSRRYAGDDATDLENRLKLLKAMEHLQDHQRNAYYECCIVLASPSGTVKHTTGLCEGSILREEKGRNGFGYDSLFVKHEYDKSFAELDESTKNRISHRYKAFEKLVPTLETVVT